MITGDDDDLDISLDDDDASQDAGEQDAGGNADDAGGDEGGDGDAGGETVIAFADEADGEDDDLADMDEKATRLIRELRANQRELSRKLAKFSRTPPPAANEGDPEPQVPDEPGPLESFDYDEDRQREAWREHREAVKRHDEWKARQSERETERARAAERQAKAIEQQRASLGVSDYEERAALVKDRLSDAQIAVLTNGAANPAKLIYALGRSPTKLETLAAEDNLAKFAVMVGGMERDIKVTKRNAPAADTRIRGATASPALNSATAKQLAKLEKEAERTGDRTALIRFKKQMKAA
jgi:hypothetical protein